jgi:hypothetical protein
MEAVRQAELLSLVQNESLEKHTFIYVWAQLTSEIVYSR